MSDAGFVVKKDVYSCVNSYLDLTGEETRCVSEQSCPGAIYEKKNLCLPINGSENWKNYRVLLYRDGTKKKYIDVEECLKMADRYTYYYWECSSLKPNNKYIPFKEMYEMKKV